MGTEKYRREAIEKLTFCETLRILTDKKRLVWEEFFKRTGKDYIGLRAAEIVPVGGYGILNALLFASSTLGDALNGTSFLRNYQQEC